LTVSPQIVSTGLKVLSAATNPNYIYTLRDFKHSGYLIAVESVGVDNLKTGSIQYSLSVIHSLWLVGSSKFKEGAVRYAALSCHTISLLLRCTLLYIILRTDLMSPQYSDRIPQSSPLHSHAGPA
jgi:hypothetical protein